MKNLNFNINGFVKPTTSAECAELLREMSRIVDEMQTQWNAIGQAVEQAVTEAA